MKSSANYRDTLIRSREFTIDNNQYWLIPFSAFDVKNITVIELLSNWRKQHEYAYPSRFPITTIGTESWLENQVMENEKRVLFWVSDKNLNRLGHLGLILNSDNEIEVDNVLKGTDEHPGLFSTAMKVLEELVLGEFGVKQLCLKVLGSNRHAIDFYEKLNYVTVEEVGMSWVESRERKVLTESQFPTDSLNRMTKELINNSDIPELILTAGPSISNLEKFYVHDAVSLGWNTHHSDYIKKFESEFAERLGVKHAMATSSCTGALHLALLSLGIGPGDEVIVPDITWVATASAVAYTGATPVFCDVDRKSWNMSVEELESLLTERTKALIPVHLYGFAAPVNEIKDFAKRHNLFLVEDAAPAIGTQIGNELAGTFGDFGCFSFQGAKLLVTGEGGMLVTNNTELYERAWKIQDHGRRPGTFWIEELGHKYKMNNITAALGFGQIQRADVQVERKREINSMYKHSLEKLNSISFQEEIPGTKSICWMTSITLGQRIESSAEELSKYLKENGVDTRPVFPTIHSYPMWAVEKDNPHASFISFRSINLPSGVTLSNKSINKVINLVGDWVSAHE